MVLKGGNRYSNISDIIYWRESNIRISNWSVWNKQKIDMRSLTNSGDLLRRLTYEIDR